MTASAMPNVPPIASMLSLFLPFDACRKECNSSCVAAFGAWGTRFPRAVSEGTVTTFAQTNRTPVFPALPRY